MLKKIENEINDFTSNIKEEKGCDDLLSYMTSDYFSSIKLLLSVSKSFSLFGRLLLFLVIASTALMMGSTIDVIAVSSTLLGAITLFLFVLTLIYISHCKKLLINGISKARSSITHNEGEG